MENVNVDLEEVLRDCDCHFTWDLETYENPLHAATGGLEEEIRKYNDKERSYNYARRFRNSLLMSYKMYQKGLDGWEKMLENSFRILDTSRNPDGPQWLLKLPSFGSPLYSGSAEDFFAYTEEVTENKTEDVHDSNLEEEGLEERLEEDGCSLAGMFVAAEHVFYSLKATMLLRIGSSSTEVIKLLTHVVHKDDMTRSERAAVLFFKAITIRHCFRGNEECMSAAIKVLKAAILLDPDNLGYLLTFIRYSGVKRRLLWGRSLNMSEMKTLIEVIDSVLLQELEPKMRVKYQFQKLQALKDMLNQSSIQESKRLHYTINELTETIVSTADEPRILSYCAQILSHKAISRAIALIEKALEPEPDSPYINARASNVYKKAGNLAKALECAEKAATEAIGSCWQVFDLKRALREEFDYEEFFCNIIRNYPLDEQTKATHRNAALFFIVEGDYYHALAHFKALLDKYDLDDEVYGETFCSFNHKNVHLVEAVYNVVANVLNSTCAINDNVRASLLGLCNTIKEAIEENFDFDDFKHAGRFNPEQYIEWLQPEKPPYRSRQAEGRMPSFRNNDSMSSGESSNSQHHFRNNWRVDGQSRKDFGNRSEPPNRTASCDYPHGLARSSEHSSRGGSSGAQNMANYFGISVNPGDTRTSQPRSAETAYNQSNYKKRYGGRPNNPPASNSNWRDRGNNK